MSNAYTTSQQFVTVNGIRFHALLEGEPSRPVLALINMASHNLFHWEPVLAPLLTHFRVLRFDIRGTGKSGWGSDHQFTFSQYADDLAAIMDTLAVPQAFVLGVAYGARTAARFALRHTQRLTALGLFDVALTPPVEQAGQRALAEQARAALRAAGEAPVAAQKYWRFYEDRAAAAKAHRAHEQESDLSEQLGSVKAPVLIACGRQDINLPEAQRIARHTPHAEFQLMEMTGHGSPLFRPALFADTVIAFATRHSG